MTGADVISDVRNELLEPVPGFFSDAELLNWINRAELDYSNRVRGFEDTATLAVVAGQSEYVLPSNCLSVVSVFYNDTNGGRDSWRALEATDLQELSADPRFLTNQDMQTTDVPSKYVIWNRNLILTKTPGQSGQFLKMYYKSKPVPLQNVTDSLNVDDTLAGAVRAYVLWHAWTKEKEFAFAQSNQAEYNNFIQEGRRWVKLQALSKVNAIKLRPYWANGNQNGFSPFSAF